MTKSPQNDRILDECLKNDTEAPKGGAVFYLVLWLVILAAVVAFIAVLPAALFVLKTMFG